MRLHLRSSRPGADRPGTFRQSLLCPTVHLAIVPRRRIFSRCRRPEGTESHLVLSVFDVVVRSRTVEVALILRGNNELGEPISPTGRRQDRRKRKRTTNISYLSRPAEQA